MNIAIFNTVLLRREQIREEKRTSNETFLTFTVLVSLN